MNDKLILPYIIVALCTLQLYLQRLNYLSTAHKLDGVFSSATLAAVKKFQLAHNAYESKYSVLLPENGYLTAATLQYLRQAFFTVYASLLRLVGNGEIFTVLVVKVCYGSKHEIVTS